MTRNDLAQLDREVLIELVLKQFEQMTQLQAEVEALRMKLEKNKTLSVN